MYSGLTPQFRPAFNSLSKELRSSAHWLRPPTPQRTSSSTSSVLRHLRGLAQGRRSREVVMSECDSRATHKTRVANLSCDKLKSLTPHATGGPVAQMDRAAVS